MTTTQKSLHSLLSFSQCGVSHVGQDFEARITYLQSMEYGVLRVPTIG
jgi:hypothetical protein